MAANSLFGRLLRQSPLKPLQEHMALVCKCVSNVTPLFEALIAGDQEQVLVLKKQISKNEGQADDIKNTLRAHLPNSLFMPVNRTDLLQVLQAQDAIADTSEDIASLLVSRKTDVPEVMHKPLMALTTRCVDACMQSKRIIDELDELLEVGFQGREAERVEQMVEDVSEIESETDKLGAELLQVLFENEDSMNPVSVVFWYQLIKWIGDIADYAEDVGDRVRLLVAR